MFNSIMFRVEFVGVPDALWTQPEPGGVHKISSHRQTRGRIISTYKQAEDGNSVQKATVSILARSASPLAIEMGGGNDRTQVHRGGHRTASCA